MRGRSSSPQSIWQLNADAVRVIEGRDWTYGSVVVLQSGRSLSLWIWEYYE